MSPGELFELFTHFLMLSLLSIGGAITVAPEMHRFVVHQRGWIDDAQFTASISLAQAAPGPNILFVTLIGWNAGGWAGAAATTMGIMLPSATVALLAGRWMHLRGELPWVKAFRAGMAPITIGLLLATGWILAESSRQSPVLLALAIATTALLAATRVNPLWLICAGALVGVLNG